MYEQKTYKSEKHRNVIGMYMENRGLEIMGILLEHEFGWV
jgi:hypothetical protein